MSSKILRSNLPFIQLSLIGNDPSMIVNVELSSSRDIKMQKKRIRIDAVENIKNLPFIQLSLIGNDPSIIKIMKILDRIANIIDFKPNELRMV